jgi:hypothetical protein
MPISIILITDATPSAISLSSPDFHCISHTLSLRFDISRLLSVTPMTDEISRR